jgi:hypothetical protein
VPRRQIDERSKAQRQVVSGGAAPVAIRDTRNLASPPFALGWPIGSVVTIDSADPVAVPGTSKPDPGVQVEHGGRTAAESDEAVLYTSSRDGPGWRHRSALQTPDLFCAGEACTRLDPLGWTTAPRLSGLALDDMAKGRRAPVRSSRAPSQRSRRHLDIEGRIGDVPGAGWNNQSVKVDDLLRRQDELQAEAAALRSDLALDTCLSGHGRVIDVGSAALGLMVWRDLDLTVVCQTLDVGPVADTGARLARHQRVRQVRFRNDTGVWNTDSGYPDGLYLGLDCRGRDDHRWNVDIWFVDQPDRQPDLAHARELPPRLTLQTRAAILLIKHAWARRPEYGQGVTSWDIYRAVLDDGVRTTADFEQWTHRRPHP